MSRLETPTRPATEAELSAPIETAHMRPPRVPADLAELAAPTIRVDDRCCAGHASTSPSVLVAVLEAIERFGRPRKPCPRIEGTSVITSGIIEHNGFCHPAELRWTARIIDGLLDEIHPEPGFDGPGVVVRKSEAQQEAWDFADENSDELIANAREG